MLIGNVVSFSIIPPAGDESLAHHLYVSLVSSQIEGVSKTCNLKFGQYQLALLLQHLFEGLPSYLGQEEA